MSNTPRWEPHQDHGAAHPILERLLRGRLRRASWLILGLAGLAMLLLGVCVGRFI